MGPSGSDGHDEPDGQTGDGSDDEAEQPASSEEEAGDEPHDEQGNCCDDTPEAPVGLGCTVVLEIADAVLVVVHAVPELHEARAPVTLEQGLTGRVARAVPFEQKRSVHLVDRHGGCRGGWGGRRNVRDERPCGSLNRCGRGRRLGSRRHRSHGLRRCSCRDFVELSADLLGRTNVVLGDCRTSFLLELGGSRVVGDYPRSFRLGGDRVGPDGLCTLHDGRTGGDKTGLELVERQRDVGPGCENGGFDVIEVVADALAEVGGGWDGHNWFSSETGGDLPRCVSESLDKANGLRLYGFGQ